MMSGRPGAALPVLRKLVLEQPTKPNLWACYGLALAGERRMTAARVALRRAVALAPGDTLFRAVASGIERPDGFVTTVESQWVNLVVR